METKRKCVGRRQTEFPEDLFKGSVQPVPLGFWHKALGNAQETLLGEKEVGRDVKFEAFLFQTWLLSCCGSAVSSPNVRGLLGLSEGLCLPQVGILDVDLCGPSIPRMLRAQDSAVHQCDSGWVPVLVGQDKAIALMSIGFLLERPDEAVVWRGPKKNGNSRALLLVEPPVSPPGGAAASWRGYSLWEPSSCSTRLGFSHSDGESAAHVVLVPSPWVPVTQAASQPLSHGSQATSNLLWFGFYYLPLLFP